MKHLKIAALVATMLTVCAAHADSTPASNWYGEVGSLGFKNTADNGNTITPSLLRLTVGNNLNETWAVEGVARLTASKANVVSTTSSATGTVSDSFYGVYVKPKYQASPDITIFGRGGFAHTSLTASINGGASETDSSTKISYGFGAELKINQNWYGALDYMQYGKYSDVGGSIKFSGITLSLGYKF